MTEVRIDDRSQEKSQRDCGVYFPHFFGDTKHQITKGHQVLTGMKEDTHALRHIRVKEQNMKFIQRT